MFGPGKEIAPAPPAASPTGAEIMLRSLGLGHVLDAANALATSGTVERILRFADQLDALDLGGLHAKLDRIEKLCRQAYDGAGLSDSGAVGLPGADAESGAGPAAGGPGQPAGPGIRLPDALGRDRPPGSAGAACGATDDGGAAYPAAAGGAGGFGR